MKKIFYLVSLVAFVLLFVQCEQGGLGLNNPSKHEYVDLGLSVKWATCNVGAENPEDYGDFFAWGETETKAYNDYGWRTYKYGTAYDEITKYCDLSWSGKNGCVDNKIILEPKDDAATVNWGGKWRMPTVEELRELISNCTWEKTTVNNVLCYRITSKIEGYTDCCIYLPAAGCANDEYGLCMQGASFYYWTSSVFTKDIGTSDCAWTYTDGEGDWGVERCYGLSVRPVCP